MTIVLSKFLKKLGFSEYQSKVYTALVRLGTATAKEIATTSKVPTPKVYISLEELAKQGVIDYYPSFPKKYRAVDLNIVLPRLVDKKRKDIHDLEKKANEAIDSFANIQATKLKEYGPQVWVCEGRDESIIRASELIEEAQESILVYRTHFTMIMKSFSALKKAAEQRDVKTRIITSEENPDVEVMDFYKKANSKIRYLKADMPVFLIIDKKKVFVSLFGKKNNLIVSDENFTKAFINIFESMWKDAKPL